VENPCRQPFLDDIDPMSKRKEDLLPLTINCRRWWCYWMENTTSMYERNETKRWNTYADKDYSDNL